MTGVYTAVREFFSGYLCSKWSTTTSYESKTPSLASIDVCTDEKEGVCQTVEISVLRGPLGEHVLAYLNSQRSHQLRLIRRMKNIILRSVREVPDSGLGEFVWPTVETGERPVPMRVGYVVAAQRGCVKE